MPRIETRYRDAERALWRSFDLDPTERWIDLPRIGVTVRTQHSGSGAPVVFVHGTMNSGATWAPLVAGLDDFHCIVLDRPGCGLSDPLPPGSNHIERFEAVGDALIADALDALQIDRASVLATSQGGYIAFRSAAAHPDRVAAVVEIGWTMGAPIGRTPILMRAAAVPGFARVMATVPPPRRAMRSIIRQAGLQHALAAGRVSDEFIDWFHALLRDTSTMRNELDAAPPIITPLRGVNELVLLPKELLARVTARAAFLWGADDPFGGAAIAEEFVAQLPDAELTIVPAAGHAPWIDDPELAVTFTRSALARASG